MLQTLPHSPRLSLAAGLVEPLPGVTSPLLLVEIIATVAILGILAVIGIVSVSNIINKGEDEYYETLEDNVALTTESYTQTNRDSLPKNVGESKNVPVSDLVDDNYIEKIKDINNNSNNN